MVSRNLVIPSKQFYLAVVLVGRIRDIDVPRVSSVVERLKALEHASEGSELGGPRGPEVPPVPAKRVLFLFLFTCDSRNLRY